MTHVLQINSSLFTDNGQSTQLADGFVSRLREREPGLTVTRRDLAAEPLPHLDADRFTAFLTAAEERSARQAALVAESDRLIAELFAADVLVIAAPMYNFSIPSALKAWFDHIARANVTFRYTENGPVGLAGGRRAVVFGARGGVYAGDADLETPYIRQFLGLLGITDVAFAQAQGLAMGDEARAQGLATAQRERDRLVEDLSAADAAPATGASATEALTTAA